MGPPTSASPADVLAVTERIGREPSTAFEVVVRDAAGAPVVVRNEPLTHDGTPMPTRFWLVDPQLSARVGRLEAAGGVRAAEAAVDPVELQAAHDRYAEERDAAIPAGHAGPRPSGGVGGTRRGVKCLHAHYAYLLAGGDDPVGRWVDEALRAEAAFVTRVAAVDIGTNSVRLLVADLEAAGDQLVTLDRRMHITRLGQGVDATRRLATDAIDRTLAVLREYRDAIEQHGAERVRATATSAARDAENRDDFFTAAKAALGTEPELLSGKEEAQLSFAGATTNLSAPAPYLVVDIGGGSTELVYGTSAPEALCSLDIGCVRVTEQWLHSDPPAPEELSNAVSAVRDHLADAEQAIPHLRDAQTMLGLAGTVTTVAAIEQGLPYDRERIHHFVLTRAAVEDVFRTLALEPAEERRHNPGLEPERVDVIVGGVIVLAAILRTFEINEVLVSEDDILDGLARSLGQR